MSYIPYNSPMDVQEVDPTSQHTVYETLVDETNIENDTLYYYIDFLGYRYAAFQLALSCDAGNVDAYLEASVQDDGTAAASCTYIDVTNALFSVASLQASAGSASAIWNISAPYNVKWLRIKLLLGAESNSGDATIYCRKTY